MRLRIFLFVFLFLFFISGVFAAGVSLSNQGNNVRALSTGELLGSGDLTVEVWDSLTGGNLIYNETFENAIVNGSWNVMLGENPTEVLELEFGRVYYYDYKVEGSDINFTTYNGSEVERQFFHSAFGEIGDEDISDTINLTLGQRIVFAFGEVIDNIVDGWIRVDGNLNVSGNLSVDTVFAHAYDTRSPLVLRVDGVDAIYVDNDTGAVGIGTTDPQASFDVNVDDFLMRGDVNVTGNVSAGYFVGDGRGLTGINGSGGLVKWVGLTAGTYTGEISYSGYFGYKAADAVCDSEYSGSHFCSEFGVASWSGRDIDGEDAWVIAGGPKYVPADIPVNDCNGWMHGSAGTYLGNYWHFNSTTGGDARAINCGTALKLACCKY